MWRTVANRYGVPYRIPQEVKDADNAVLIAESEFLMGPKPCPWPDILLPDGLLDSARERLLPVRNGTLFPEDAETLFLARFAQVNG
jgi:hypothetical protein